MGADKKQIGTEKQTEEQRQSADEEAARRCSTISRRFI